MVSERKLGLFSLFVDLEISRSGIRNRVLVPYID